MVYLKAIYAFRETEREDKHRERERHRDRLTLTHCLFEGQLRIQRERERVLLVQSTGKVI